MTTTTTTLPSDTFLNSNSVAVAASVTGVGAGGNCGVENNNGTTNRLLNKNLNISNNLNGTSNSNSNSNNQSNNYAVVNNIGTSMQRGVDVSKRKKLKSRTASAPHTGYTKDHLDAWLETCLKDASNTQLSSSSEFLDYNPAPSNKNMFAQQAQQQQHHPQQQQQQPQALQQAYPTSNQQFFSQQQQQQQQHQLQQQSQTPIQQQFLMRNNPPPPLSYPSGYSAPFSQGLQRGAPNFMRHTNSYNNRYSTMFPSIAGGGFYQQNDGSQDFASLPPIVNMLGGGSSELENNSTDVLDGSGSNPNMSRGFRFSDPCLLNPSDNDSKVSGQNTPDQRTQPPSDLENNKFFTALMEQINLLHETNSKICRNLHETKVDIEALKHAPTWGLRHRRDSLSGLSTHSQPMVFGGGFGTHSPAPTYHSGAYTPGIMTDVVREVKEAARVREDALLNRVKSMVEERQWSMNESNLRMMHTLEELKSQIQHLRVDRKEMNKRLNHLEAENKYMRQTLANMLTNRQMPDVIYENEAICPRKNFPNPRRSQSLNLHYGTIHHQPAPTSSLVVEEHGEPLRIVENVQPNALPTEVSVSCAQRPTSDVRNSFSSSEGGVVGGGSLIGTPGTAKTAATVNSSATSGQLMSPPSFAIVSSPQEETKSRKERLEKQQRVTEEKSEMQLDRSKHATEELQQELIEAVEARQQADERIIALENLVKHLQVDATTITHRSDPSFSPLTNLVGDLRMGLGVVDNGTNKHTTTLSSVSYVTKRVPRQPALTWQQQQQPSTGNHSSKRQHQAHTNVSTSVTVSHSPPKLSVAGPITDL